MLSSEDLQNNVGLYLACDIYYSASCILYSCGTEVEPFATHGLSCKMSKVRHSGHSEVNDLNAQALSSAGFNAKLEPSASRVLTDSIL